MVSAVAILNDLVHVHSSTKNTYFAKFSPPSSSLKPLSNSTRKLLFRVHRYVPSNRIPILTSFKPFSPPVMEWQDCTVKMEVDVPVSVAYDRYSDRESIPRWMPFISSVKVLEDKPDLSRWSLRYKAFGRDIQFSWLARNMQPIPNQKIHWRSLEGLPNRFVVENKQTISYGLKRHVCATGAVRFYPKGPESCMVELTVSYEVPQLLAPVASALQPFLESLLIRGLERFAKFAKSYYTD
ncbi:hypothetical protein K2173_008104 [Erythroxylum novogranatense]|uniref:Coenzyme Q-binding protein COQ10 START domain-containing protein n=1 Tax=Erythroxylum novogranatense TaxID=1862640 RepID=A0AAV8S942_9ROSI|nr:hypothetical protein K2173_008104 [Erythroxylum novogranatense]